MELTFDNGTVTARPIVCAPVHSLTAIWNAREQHAAYGIGCDLLSSFYLLRPLSDYLSAVVIDEICVHTYSRD